MVIAKRSARAREQSGGEAWSGAEVALIVEDYLDMFEEELAGRPYSKAAHWRAMIPRLDGRTRQSIEYKHGNISAALRDMRYPFIDGYKPYSNYQHKLVLELERQLQSRRRLDDLLASLITAPVAVPQVDDILSSLVAPPKPDKILKQTYEREPMALPKRDYAAMEAGNRALGQAGEEFVVSFERARLIAAGRPRYADRVEQVSASRGDGLGYDVLSFETSGRERLIEVKTTKFGIYTPFLISSHEVRFSDVHAKEYALYRLFDMRNRPRLYQLTGSIARNAYLDPVQFAARVRGPSTTQALDVPSL